MSPRIHHLRGCVIKLRTMIRVRCLRLRPGILAEKMAREGGTRRSAYLEICARVSEEPSAGRHHCPIPWCTRDTAAAQALQTPATNRALRSLEQGKIGGLLLRRPRHPYQVSATHNERRREQRPGHHEQVPREPKRGCGQQLGQGPHTKKLSTNSDEPPSGVAAFEVNSEPHNGARPSVCLCVWPELARCVHCVIT
jgi:hypothetical protein